MEFSEKPKLPRHRRVILLLLVLLVLGGYLTVMFNLQIVHGADYRRQSVSQIVRSTTVEAARGDITDRNGNLMVGNRQTYTLTFDPSLLPDGADQNEAILRLIQLCEENNIPCTDNVPLSKTAPFTYVTVTDTQQRLFDRYLTDTLQPYLEKELKKRKNVLAAAAEKPKKAEPVAEDPFLDDPDLDVENLTAPQLMEAMRRSFKIDDSVSDADARKIVPSAGSWPCAPPMPPPAMCWPTMWIST